MSTLAIDTRKLLKALKAAGKSANFTAEEIADAVDVAPALQRAPAFVRISTIRV